MGCCLMWPASYRIGKRAGVRGMMRVMNTEAKLKNKFEEYTDDFDGIDAIAEKRYYFSLPKEFRKDILKPSGRRVARKKDEYMRIAVGAPDAELLKGKHNMKSAL